MYGRDAEYLRKVRFNIKMTELIRPCSSGVSILKCWWCHALYLLHNRLTAPKVFWADYQLLKVARNFRKLRALFKSCVHFSKVARNFSIVNFQKLRALFKSCTQLSKVACTFRKLRATIQRSIFKSCAQLLKVACTFQMLCALFKWCVHFSKVARTFRKVHATFETCAQLSKSARNF